MSTATATNLSYVPEAPATPEIAALRACPVFASATLSGLQALARSSSIKHFTPGSTIAAEGSATDGAFLVIRGRARAVRRGENGREVTVETFRGADLCADAALESGAGLQADLVAAETTLVLVIPKDALQALMRTSPDAAIAMARALAGRLRRSKDLAVGLVLSDVPGRVTWALRALCAQDGQETPEGVLVRQRPTQQELANTIGACRETVSRIVSDLARQGLLTPKGRGLLVSRKLLAD